MSVNRAALAFPDRPDGICRGALLYALDRRSGLRSAVNTLYDEDVEDDDDELPCKW